MKGTHEHDFFDAQNDGIMTRLKLGTTALHRHAETRPLQRAMIMGSVTRNQFSAYLAQLWLIHRALETHLRACRSEQPLIARVNREHQFRASDLEEDLVTLGMKPATIKPLPAVALLLRSMARAAQDNPIALLGMLYVLEGSTNGSRLIAQRLGRAPPLQDVSKLRSLDPYGDRQAEHWQTFKADMNALSLNDEQAGAIVHAAKKMFMAIAHMSEQVVEEGPTNSVLGVLRVE